MTAQATRRWFTQPLESNTPLWRVMRRDGVTLGFAMHDRDIWVDNIHYHAAPGILPSAIEGDGSLESDIMDIKGALHHDLISETDLLAGRYDGAYLSFGLVDWRAPEQGVDWMFRGEFGAVVSEGDSFSVTILSQKSMLDAPFVPVTSPDCRAEFCGEKCGLSRQKYSFEARYDGRNDAGQYIFTMLHRSDGMPIHTNMAAHDFDFGRLIWLDGAYAGLRHMLWAVEKLTKSQQYQCSLRPYPMENVGEELAAGSRVIISQGCDKNYATCRDRFGNHRHFQGEPYLPGNDMLTRFPGG